MRWLFLLTAQCFSCHLMFSQFSAETCEELTFKSSCEGSNGTICSRGFVLRLENCGEGANLANMDLRSADLSQLTLKDADLRGANLESANLRGVDLEGADLTSANLENANLSEAKAGFLRGCPARLPSDAFHCELTSDGSFALLGPAVELVGVDLRGLDLSSFNLAEVLFTNADLRSTNLSSVNFSGSDLSGVLLEGADITNADFRNAQLTPTTGLNNAEGRCTANYVGAHAEALDLSSCDLNGRDFSSALLRFSSFINANLSNANLQNTDFTGTNFTNANMQQANADNAIVVNSNFLGADLLEASIHRLAPTGLINCPAVLPSADYVCRNLGISQLTIIGPFVDISQVGHQGQDFSNMNLEGLVFVQSNIVTADFSNSNLRNSDLRKTAVTGANLMNTNLSGANLFQSVGVPDNASFSIYANTICPNGVNSDNAGGTCIGQGF